MVPLLRLGRLRLEMPSCYVDTPSNRTHDVLEIDSSLITNRPGTGSAIIGVQTKIYRSMRVEIFAQT